MPLSLRLCAKQRKIRGDPKNRRRNKTRNLSCVQTSPISFKGKRRRLHEGNEEPNIAEV